MAAGGREIVENKNKRREVKIKEIKRASVNWRQVNHSERLKTIRLALRFFSQLGHVTSQVTGLVGQVAKTRMQLE